MGNLNQELYRRVVDEVLGLNEFEAKDKLCEILKGYSVEKLELDPNRYDITANIKKFIAEKDRQGMSHHTISNYQRHLGIFEQRMDKKLQEITKDDIAMFLDSRENDPRVTAKTTLQTIRYVLLSFFGWLKDEGIIDENPVERIPPYKTGKPMQKALTVDELETVREACETTREKALVELLYSTGCRLEEFVDLNIEDIDRQNKMVKVNGKSEKERIVFFSSKADIYLRKYLSIREDDCPALMVTERKPYRRLTHRGVQKIVRKIGERSGVNKQITPHVFRHTMATMMLNRGCPMSVVQELLGHDQLATTEIYARVTHSNKQQSYEKYFHQ